MALRDYMQDLLSAQIGGDENHEVNSTFRITIIDDNSSSALPDDYDQDIENVAMCNRSMTGPDGIVRSSDHRGCIRIQFAGEREESRDNDSNRIMLDGFRRRKKFLRETLSPRSASAAKSPLQFSPSPIVTQWTPPDGVDEFNNIVDDNCSSEKSTRDSQRYRMRRLKTSLNSSPPLV